MLAYLRAGHLHMSRKIGVVYLGIFILVLLSGITGPREITIYVDGEPQNIYTYRTHVAEILAEAGIELREEDKVHPSQKGLLGTGSTINVQKAFPVYLRIDGQVMPAYSTGETVAQLAHRLKVSVTTLDQAVPGWKTQVSPTQVVLIHRVELKEEAVVEEVAAEVLFKPDSSLPQGTTRVADEGEAGLLARVYQLTVVNGQVAGRELLSLNMLKEPVPRVILQGTAPRTTRVARASLRVGDTWQGRASWYGAGFHGRRTASGEIYDMHAMTAAHPFLPFGTLVTVTHLRSGRYVEVRINDRGPFIGGRIIDLSRGAAEVIGMIDQGVAEVRLKITRLP